MDPITEQNLLLALIGLISAATVWLQQRNAAEARKDRESVKQDLVAQSATTRLKVDTVNRVVGEKLDQIQQNTNGKLQDLDNAVNKVVSEKLDKIDQNTNGKLHDLVGDVSAIKSTHVNTLETVIELRKQIDTMKEKLDKLQTGENIAP